MENGSIQRKGTHLYLVVRCEGHQKWITLKTSEMATARERARELLPQEECGERGWLEHLVRLGRIAGKKLAVIQGRRSQDWDELLKTYLEKNGLDGEDEAERSHRRWLFLLKGAAGGLAPGEIGHDAAEQAAISLSEKYVSCRRMVGFFRRCWLAAGLDASVWNLEAALKRRIGERGKSREFYRRFTVEETRRIYRSLRETAPDLADMAAIGYMTGLRLSDIAELDSSEVAADRASLRITPNKTRRRKPRPLTIPLIHEAAEAVARRMAAVCAFDSGKPAAPYGENAASGGLYLFPEEMRHRPSRRMCAALARCDLAKSGCARASFHSFRATFISMMDEAGVSPHITDAITGHGGGGMHARYTQPSAAALRNALICALPPLNDSTQSSTIERS